MFILHWLPSTREARKWSFLAGHMAQSFITNKEKGRMVPGWTTNRQSPSGTQIVKGSSY